jgi:hypothetical protein
LLIKSCCSRDPGAAEAGDLLRDISEPGREISGNKTAIARGERDENRRVPKKDRSGKISGEIGLGKSGSE